MTKYAPLLFLLFVFSVSAASHVDAAPDKAKSVDKAMDKGGKAVIPDGLSEKKVKDKWGVEEFKIRLTSAGYMLDVRYRVTDKVKAKPLFKRQLRPFVIDEATGVRYGVPSTSKLGYIRQAPSSVKENKVYFLLIANPGKRLKRGDKLSLVIGDFKVEHIIVE